MTGPSPTASKARIGRDRQAAVFERGLERCRNGDWKDGLVDLAWLVEHGARGEVPSLCYSYLGYGFAHRGGQVKKGLRLCRHAIKLEFFQPENYVNLARTALLSKRYRRQAATAVLDGLEIDPDNPELLELQKKLGARRPPVLRFLSRRNLLNRILGRLRHDLTRRKPAPKGSSA
jgi:hypothetical protein